MANKKNKIRFGLDRNELRASDWELAKKRIRNDIKTDFIIAPHYNGIFSRSYERLSETVAKELETGGYGPNLPLTIDVPKSTRMRVKGPRRNGPSFFRPGSILGPKDRLVYQMLADRATTLVSDLIDRERSFGYWPKPTTSPEMFVPGRVCWNEMHAKMKSISQSNKINYVLKADIANYFSNINLHTLKDLLTDRRYPTPLNNLLENVLVHFTGTRSSRGIIQGVAPSDLFGNFYLYPLDQFIADAGIPAVRFVDDFYIFVDDVRDADRVVRMLNPHFRSYDLSLNEAKTYVFQKAQLVTEEPHLERLFSDAIEEVRTELSEEELDAEYGFQSEWEEEEENDTSSADVELLATKRLFDEMRHFEGEQEKIERFCLPLLAKTESDHAVDHVLRNFTERPSMAQIYCRYLAVFMDSSDVVTAMVRFATEEELYDWQRMWVLAALNTASDAPSELVRHCLSWISKSTHHEALRALAALYVGKNGAHADRRRLAAEYTSVGSEYVRGAILYAARYFPRVEKANAIAQWGSHSEINQWIAEAL